MGFYYIKLAAKAAVSHEPGETAIKKIAGVRRLKGYFLLMVNLSADFASISSLASP